MTASNRFDVLVIGAGANGLVAAAALGKAGKSVLLVDGAGAIGGQSRTDEFAPGFRSAPFATDAGWVPPIVTKGLGLSPIPSVDPEFGFTVATEAGDFLAVPRDATRAAEAIRKHSARDAERWGDFVSGLRKLTGFLEALYQLPSPDIDTTALGEIMPLLGLGRKFRALGRDGMTDLLRVLPMSVDDLVGEVFENAALRAGIGAGGIRDIRQGPRSGGTTLVLLHYLIGAPPGSLRARSWWRDSPDAFNTVVESIAKQSGVTIRTGNPVARILVQDDAVAGAIMADAEEIFARNVISTADPATTMLQLIDPVWLDPDFIQEVRNIRFRGCTAVVQFAVDKLPDIPGLNGIVSLTPDLVALEKAYDASKYHNVSEHPHIELTAPTLRWPSMAPQGKHILLARVQYAPYDLRDGAAWDAARSKQLGDTVVAAIARVAPGFAGTVLHRDVLTPADIEAKYGVTEGAITHGELMLDQFLFMRPVAGYGRHKMPIPGLYLGGAGAHPGPGVLGGAGWLAAQQVLADAKKTK